MGKIFCGGSRVAAEERFSFTQVQEEERRMSGLFTFEDKVFHLKNVFSDRIFIVYNYCGSVQYYL